MAERGLQIFERRNYRGLYSLREASEIPPNFASHVLNADLSSSSQISPMKGYSRFANQSNPNNDIISAFLAEDGFGFQIPVVVRDNGTNTILEYLNRGDIRNNPDGEWLVLYASFTTALPMSFALFNDTGTHNLLMSNGTENLSRWSMGICVMDGAVAAGASTITVKKVTGDPKTNPTDGFPASGTIVYRDTAGAIKSLAYSSKTATVFTMTTPADTTASATNTGVAEAVDTTTYSAAPKFRFIFTGHGRLYGTDAPTQPTVLQGSAVSDFSDFTNGTTPSSAFTEDFPEGGRNLALAVIDEWVIIFKERQVLGLGFQFPTSTTRVTTRKHISDVGIAYKYALTRVGNDWWYVSPGGQIRRLSRIAAESVFQTEDLNNLIRPTIANFLFDEAACGYFPRERIFVVSAKSDSDQGANNRVITIQFSEDEMGNPIINHGILDWFVNGWFIYQDNFYFGPSSGSRVYKAFDGYSKDNAGYRFEYTTRLEHFGKEYEQKQVLFLGVKGRLGAGTQLNVDVYFDEEAKTALYEYEISQDDSDYVTAGVSNPLGVNALGSEPLGGTIADVSDLDPFIVFFEIPQKANPHMVQVNFYTDGEGQRAVINSHAWYVAESKMINPPINLKKGSKI